MSVYITRLLWLKTAAAEVKNNSGYFEIHALFFVLGLSQFSIWGMRLAAEQKITLLVILAGLGFFVLVPCIACAAVLLSPVDIVPAPKRASYACRRLLFVTTAILTAWVSLELVPMDAVTANQAYENAATALIDARHKFQTHQMSTWGGLQQFVLATGVQALQVSGCVSIFYWGLAPQLIWHAFMLATGVSWIQDAFTGWPLSCEFVNISTCILSVVGWACTASDHVLGALCPRWFIREWGVQSLRQTQPLAANFYQKVISLPEKQRDFVIGKFNAQYQSICNGFQGRLDALVSTTPLEFTVPEVWLNVSILVMSISILVALACFSCLAFGPLPKATEHEKRAPDKEIPAWRKYVCLILGAFVEEFNGVIAGGAACTRAHQYLESHPHLLLFALPLFLLVTARSGIAPPNELLPWWQQQFNAVQRRVETLRVVLQQCDVRRLESARDLLAQNSNSAIKAWYAKEVAFNLSWLAFATGASALYFMPLLWKQLIFISSCIFTGNIYAAHLTDLYRHSKKMEWGLEQLKALDPHGAAFLKRMEGLTRAQYEAHALKIKEQGVVLLREVCAEAEKAYASAVHTQAAIKISVVVALVLILFAFTGPLYLCLRKTTAGGKNTRPRRPHKLQPIIPATSATPPRKIPAQLKANNEARDFILVQDGATQQQTAIWDPLRGATHILRVTEYIREIAAQRDTAWEKISLVERSKLYILSGEWKPQAFIVESFLQNWRQRPFTTFLIWLMAETCIQAIIWIIQNWLQ